MRPAVAARAAEHQAMDRAELERQEAVPRQGPGALRGPVFEKPEQIPDGDAEQACVARPKAIPSFLLMTASWSERAVCRGAAVSASRPGLCAMKQP